MTMSDLDTEKSVSEALLNLTLATDEDDYRLLFMSDVKLLLKDYKELVKENEELSANACVHPLGVIGDDHGHPTCPLSFSPNKSNS